MAGDVPTPRGPAPARVAAALAALAVALFAFGHALLPGWRAAWLSLVDTWFFAADRVDPIAPLAVAGWLLLRRRPRLAERRGPPAWPAAFGAGLTSLGLLAWSRFSGAPEPAVLALVATSLTAVLAWGGRGAARVAALPIGLLLFALPLPAPLYNAVIWKLQLWTSVCVSGVLQALGLEPRTSGDVILVGALSFHVIESCAGLRIVQLLTLLAVALSDVLGLRGARALAFVAAAPVVGFGVNGLRALSIAVAPRSSQEVHHLSQGLVTFGIACALQYGLGLALARRKLRHRAPPTPPGARPAERSRCQRGSVLAAMALAAGLAGVSLAVPTPERTPALGPALARRLAAPLPGWKWEERPRPLVFLGATRYDDSLRRLYWPEGADGGDGAEGVELFAGLDSGGTRNGFPFGPKTALPGPGWVAEREATAASPLPGTTLRVWVVRQGEQRARVHEYRSGDRGLFVDSLRWLAGLDRAGAPTRRVLVRLATTLADGAEERLDALFEALREPLTEVLVEASPGADPSNAELLGEGVQQAWHRAESAEPDAEASSSANARHGRAH